MHDAVHELSPDTFQRDGYLVVCGLADPTRVGELCETVLGALDPLQGPAEFETDVGYPGSPSSRDAAGGDTPRRLLTAYSRGPVFRRWVTAPELASTRRSVRREDRIEMSQCRHHNRVMTKHPGFSSSTAWHQHIRYGSFDAPELVSVWLALGAEREENGAQRVIAGSHRLPLDRGRFDRHLFLRPELDANRALVDTAASAPSCHCSTSSKTSPARPSPPMPCRPNALSPPTSPNAAPTASSPPRTISPIGCSTSPGTSPPGALAPAPEFEEPPTLAHGRIAQRAIRTSTALDGYLEAPPRRPSLHAPAHPTPQVSWCSPGRSRERPPMTITDHAKDYVGRKPAPGLSFTNQEQVLMRYGESAGASGEVFVRNNSVPDWAGTAMSPGEARRRLSIVRAVAVFVHVEDDRQEVPHRDALGTSKRVRTPPCIPSPEEIRMIMTQALSLPPTGSLTPLTFHTIIGLIACTGPEALGCDRAAVERPGVDGCVKARVPGEQRS